MLICWLTFISYIFLFAGPPERLENSLQIKRAGGLQRGKTDAVDAVRIAEYACRFRDKIRLWQPPRQVIQQLAARSGVRQRLLSARQQLQQPLQEQQGFLTPSLQKQLTKTCRVGGPTDIIESHQS
jgi:transposase